jgi:transcriptional regulator with XRE-family HTH domain
VDPEELRSIIAANLRRAAAQRGLSLNQLCDLAGVTRSAFYRAVTGKGAMSTDSIAKLAEALEVEPAELLTAPPEE